MAEREASLSYLLLCCRRGLDLIDSTESRQDRRVMLSLLLRDLEGASELLAGATQEQAAELLALRSEAAGWRKRIGPPVSPGLEVRNADSNSRNPRRAPRRWGRRLREAPSISQPLTAIRPGRADVDGGEGDCQAPAAPLRELRGRREEGIPGIEEGSALTEPRLLEVLPAARFWVEAGVGLGQAGKLVRAGFPSLESLKSASRDELLAIPGIGNVTIWICEQLLGRRLPSVIGDWQAQGFSSNAAAALAGAGIDSLEALARLTEGEIAGLGLRNPDRQLCETLLGRRLRETPVPPPARKRAPEAERAIRALHQQVLQQLAAFFARTEEGPVTDEDPARLVLWEAARGIESVIDGAPQGLDLTIDHPATREALHEWVVRHHFALRVLDDPGDILISAHTPEECQLRVYFEYGRWFATWLKLEVDESQPEVRRRALILFETGRQGELVETAV